MSKKILFRQTFSQSYSFEQNQQHIVNWILQTIVPNMQCNPVLDVNTDKKVAGLNGTHPLYFHDYLPVNTAFLFSKNAEAPSFISAVAKQSPKAVISTS